MNRFKIYLVLISCIIIGFSYADDDYEKEHYKYKKHHFYKNLDYLNLSSEQSSQIRTILLESKKAYRTYYKQKIETEHELRQLLKESYFDEKKYQTIKSELMEQALLLESKKLKKIHSVLDEEQRKKFSYFLQEWEVE